MNNKSNIFLVLLLTAYNLCATSTLKGSGIQTPGEGMTIWNIVLHIAPSDTLAIHTNLYLYDAGVQGNGVVLMTNTISRHIVSHKSNLPYLQLDNTDTIALYGDLSIRCGLIIAKGVFDTRRGNLLLSDTASLAIFPEGKWLQKEELYWWSPVFPLTSQLQPVSTQKYVQNNIKNDYAAIQKNDRGSIYFPTPVLSSGWVSKPSPPPKVEAFIY